ncbi:hypothetical protein NDU88_000883 [Pleurodeles waltl]|uniref:Uncharacterized protein n=1 Tax=Pleurodeles waltl TaxID=8319 RepID=A0AAV7TH31_PLEWA|nr:hypothetical protein NDU88_000883 [Pleurodeles waltl]
MGPGPVSSSHRWAQDGTALVPDLAWVPPARTPHCRRWQCTIRASSRGPTPRFWVLWRSTRPKSKLGEEEMSRAGGDGNALYALVLGASPFRSGFSGVPQGPKAGWAKKKCPALREMAMRYTLVPGGTPLSSGFSGVPQGPKASRGKKKCQCALINGSLYW